MANNIYLMVDEKKEYTNIKVGFTGNFFQRVIAYGTVSPDTYCLSRVETYRKTGRELEKAIHAELASRGYSRKYSRLTGSKTEWFAIANRDEFLTEIMEKGLLAFDACKGRKEIGGWDIVNKRAF